MTVCLSRLEMICWLGLRSRWIFWLILVMLTYGQMGSVSAIQRRAPAYTAVFEGEKGRPISLWYDQGKYALQIGETLSLCDNVQPPARWHIDLKTKTARLDFSFLITQLRDRIKKDGIDTTAQSLHIDRSLLSRFARHFQHYIRRNLNRTLNVAEPSSRRFQEIFERNGVEKVAGWRCDRYRSRTAPDRTLWVEPSTGYILRERTVYVPDNPRIQPVQSETAVAEFHVLRSVDSKRFQIPPDVTALIPRFLADLALPSGVKRRLLTGDQGKLGFDLKQVVETSERYDPPSLPGKRKTREK